MKTDLRYSDRALWITAGFCITIWQHNYLLPTFKVTYLLNLAMFIMAQIGLTSVINSPGPL